MLFYIFLRISTYPIFLVVGIWGAPSHARFRLYLTGLVVTSERQFDGPLKQCTTSPHDRDCRTVPQMTTYPS